MAPTTASQVRSRHLWLPVDGCAIEGDLAVPDGATGIVLFLRGSGSSRMSSRRRKVARRLQEGGLATLRFDLLTPMEDEEDKRTGRVHFEVKLLSERLMTVTDLVAGGLGEGELRIGYFGAGFGTAAALIAAAKRPRLVHGVVLRDGRLHPAQAVPVSLRARTLRIGDVPDTEVARLATDWFIKCLAPPSYS